MLERLRKFLWYSGFFIGSYVKRVYRDFFHLTPPPPSLLPVRLECSTIRKSAWLIQNIKIQKRVEWKRGKFWKLQLFKVKSQVYISYLGKVKTITMFCNFTASFNLFFFWRYLNSSMKGFSSDILLPYLQIWMIWTVLWCLGKSKYLKNKKW